MTKIEVAHDIPDADGVTPKQRNYRISHSISLGTLVEINLDGDHSDKCRLFVVAHTRNCDGTPLYDLSFKKDSAKNIDDYNAEIAAIEEIQLRRQLSDDEKMNLGLTKFCLHHNRGSILRGYPDNCLSVITD